MNRVIVTGVCVAAALVASTTCWSESSDRVAASQVTSTSPATIEFQERIHRNSVVTFRSWNGKALRMDSDTELAFFPDHTVEMLEYGFTLSRYTGTYRIRSNGEISVQFRDFRGTWPDMLLERAGTSLLLRPADPEVGFVMGNRGGATIPSGAGSYWPFREVVGADKKQILETLGRR